MRTHAQPHVGEPVRLTRSGHSDRGGEQGTIVAILGEPGREFLRVRWCDGRETFIPARVVHTS